MHLGSCLKDFVKGSQWNHTKKGILDEVVCVSQTLPRLGEQYGGFKTDGRHIRKVEGTNL